MDNGQSVGSLHYDLDIDDKNLGKQLDAADKNVKGFADRLHDGLNKAAAGFAVVGAGLSLISKNATDFTVNAVKSAKMLGTQIGVSTTEASRLVAAFGRMGISAEDASRNFGIFAKNIVEATKNSKDATLQTEKTQIAMDKTRRSIADTTKEIKLHGDKSGELALKLRGLNSFLKIQQATLDQTADGFAKLGIKTTDAKGVQKDFNTLLFEVADKFKAMPNGIDKTATAMQLFGRSGKEMIKILNLGSEGIQQLEKDADRLGLTLTPETVDKVSKYIKSQKDLKQSTDAIKIAIGTATAPVMANFNTKLAELEQRLLAIHGPIHTAIIDVLAFGGPILVAAGGLLSIAANLVQAAPLLAAIAFNPFTLIALGAIATAAAVYELFTHLDQVRRFFASDWGVAIQLALAVFAPFLLIPLEVILHWQAVLDFFKGLWGWIVTNWPALVGALTNPFGVAVALITGHLNGIKNAVVGFASDAWHWLYDAGRNIISGLGQGIKDRVSEAVKAIENAGHSIINAARGVLSWHSPSKVFMEAGRAISQGLAMGINQNAGLAFDAMSKLGNNVIAPSVGLNLGNGAGGASALAAPGNTVINIGTIQDKSDADYILRQIDRNQQRVNMGVSPG